MPDAAGSLGSLFVELTANYQQLQAGMEGAKHSVEKGVAGIEQAVEGAKKVVEGFIAVFALEKIVEWGRGIMESIDHLKKFADEIDVNIQKVGGLQFAAEKANVGDVFELGMRKFANAAREAQVQGSAMARVFQTMGLDPFAPLDQGLLRTADYLANTTGAANKMGIVEELLGTRNARLITLLNGGSEELKKQMGLYDQLIGPNGIAGAAEASEEFNDAMIDLKKLAQGLFVDISKDVIPMFTHWALALRENHDIIHDLGAMINQVLVPSLKLASLGLEMTVVGLTQLTSWGMKAMNVISPLGVMLGKLAVNKISAQVPGSENFAADLGKNFDNFKNLMDKLSKDIDVALAKEMSGHTDVIKHGNDAMEKQVKVGAANVAQIKKYAEDLTKIIESFNVTKQGIQKDIFNIKGMDAAAQFTGYQQEVEAAQKAFNDLKKIQDSKINMTKDEQNKLLELQKLYGQKQQALMVAQNVLVMDAMMKANDQVLSAMESLGLRQTGLYKTMFAASKAFAIAESSVKIAQGIAEAAGAPWPLNLFAMAQVIAQTASIVSSIQAVKLEFGGGKAAGGPVSPDKMFLVGERGPEMFVPPSAGNIVPNGRLGGGTVNVEVHNYTDAQPQVVERNNGEDRTIEVILRRVKNEIGSDIKDGKGPIPKALQNTFGLRRGQTQ